ncbi:MULTISPECIES: carbohydrate ABC transporter permease [Pandoraea]|uniref:carbohydrate ABC transporter permease n=1 Tax=Pandoraea TaxID=93217 RepID=UPI001F5D33FC|nr:MULTISPECIES: carbohydrate ABC transporter permease [Pandoraea]MCI3207980.1 carbohydrate ABC transporter permease [Pandoraea sp. LA3]MDN4586009.1 carbohydrate ABC transporter permease [Pandoraea capi]
MSRIAPMNRQGRAMRVVRHAVLWVTGLISLAPFVWMLLTACKPANEVFGRELHILPAHYACAENFATVFSMVPMLRYLANGAFVVVVILALQLLLALPCAYVLAKIPHRGRGVLFGAVVFCLMLPTQVVAIPQFLLAQQLGLVDSIWAVALPHAFSAFGIYLLRQYFQTIPDELLDAARLDGFSEFAIVFRLMLPVALPAVIAFGIFSVTAHWNEFFWPQIVLSSPEKLLPPLGIAFFRNEEAGTDYGALMAAASIVIAPLVIAFLLAQRRFIEGIALSGLKG